MKAETEDRCATRQVAELRPCSALEAVRREVHDVHVGDDEQVVLSATDRAHHKYFARVKFSAFEDLQVLGFVPRGLRQEAIRSAMVEDDHEALRLARERMPKDVAPSPCHCNGHGERVASFSESLRATVRSIRRDYNPALARLLSSHYGTEFEWDSTLAASVRGWASRYVSGGATIIALVNDITIGRGARLQVDASSTSLLARHIWIHRTGTLAHNGGFLKVWASSIETFVIDWSEIVSEVAKDRSVAKWAIKN